MSYCVNCGVELEKSEKACPLCSVEVINPLQPYDDKALRPFPKRLDPINERINRRFTASIISICLASPAVFCVVINVILDGQATWSLLVAGALALLWVLVVPYFIYQNPTVIKVFLPATLAILLYLLLISSLLPDGRWFLAMAMPLSLLACGMILINSLLISAGLIRGFSIPAIVLVSSGLLNVGIELIIDLFLFRRVQFGWSLFVLIPSAAVAAIFLALARRQSIREEIKKRLHL